MSFEPYILTIIGQFVCFLNNNKGLDFFFFSETITAEKMTEKTHIHTDTQHAHLKVIVVDSNQTQMIDGGHDVVDFGVPYGMEQFLDGHRSVIGRRVLLKCQQRGRRRRNH